MPDGQILIYRYASDNPYTLVAIDRDDLIGSTPILARLDYQYGRLSHLQHGNGQTTDYVYDATGQLTAIQRGQGMGLAYAYDAAGNIIGIDTQGTLSKFHYDPLGRLTQADTSLGVNNLNETSDREIDIVGFSRGSAMAIEFANRITELSASGKIKQPFSIRFIGIFDMVGSFGLAGNSCDVGYNLSVPGSVEFVAHAVALNEHRQLYPLSSIEPDSDRRGSDPARIEQGFIGAHSDIGGGYGDSDLSDVALIWMVDQARRAGVPLGSLDAENLRVDRPVLHDERAWLGRWSDVDREVYYPSDPEWKPPRDDLFYDYEDYLDDPDPTSERMRDNPDYTVLKYYIESGSEVMTVDMASYLEWLRINRGFRVEFKP